MVAHLCYPGSMHHGHDQLDVGVVQEGELEVKLHQTPAQVDVLFVRAQLRQTFSQVL